VLLVEGVAMRIATSRNSPGENRRTDMQVRAVAASLRRFPLEVPFWSSWNDDTRSVSRVGAAEGVQKAAGRMILTSNAYKKIVRARD